MKLAAEGLEDYFKQYGNIECTHGFCPDCEGRLYGTHSRPPFPYVLPILQLAEQEQLPLTVDNPSMDDDAKKPATKKPRAKENEKEG